MSAPSQQHADQDLPVSTQDKVCGANEVLISSAAAAEAEVEVDELCCLSGDKPFWDVIIAKSHVCSPYYMHVPSRMVSVLPGNCNEVPAVFEHGGKKWDLTLLATGKQRRFEYTGWRRFAWDNNLECDDACIFEVMESSPTLVRLRVLVLRNTGRLPHELEPDSESRGKTVETAIEID